MSKALRHHLYSAKKRALIGYGAEGLALLVVLIFVFASLERTKLSFKSNVATRSVRAQNQSTPTPSPEQRQQQAQILFTQGTQLTRDRRYQEAAGAYQKAITLDPNLAEAHHELAFALYRLGRYRESIAASQQAIRLRTDNPDTYRNLGMAYAGLQQWKEASEAFSKALNIAPEDANTYYQLGLVFKNTNVDAAIDAFQDAVRLKPDLAAARFELGLAYASAEEFNLAREQYDILLELNPKLAEKLSKSIAAPTPEN